MNVRQSLDAWPGKASWEHSPELDIVLAGTPEVALAALNELSQVSLTAHGCRFESRDLHPAIQLTPREPQCLGAAQHNVGNASGRS